MVLISAKVIVSVGDSPGMPEHSLREATELVCVQSLHKGCNYLKPVLLNYTQLRTLRESNNYVSASINQATDYHSLALKYLSKPNLTCSDA